MDFAVISVATILILMGIGSMALSVIGVTTTAQVTGYEQVLFINNDDATRNPSRYKLEYQFAVGGERYTGSVTRVFEGGSHMRQTLPVRYLSFCRNEFGQCFSYTFGERYDHLQRGFNNSGQILNDTVYKGEDKLKRPLCNLRERSDEALEK